MTRQGLVKLKRTELIDLCLQLSVVAEINKVAAERSLTQAIGWKQLYEGEQEFEGEATVH